MKILVRQYQEPYLVLIMIIEYMDGINKNCILYIIMLMWNRIKVICMHLRSVLHFSFWQSAVTLKMGNMIIPVTLKLGSVIIPMTLKVE